MRVRLLLTGQAGQALTEYALIVGVVSVAIAMALSALGLGLNELFRTILSSLP